ncbi:TPA: phage tail protein, partial [Clostridium perfringens]|nr:phage tail protein [Clostridium perfringens]
MSKLVTTGIDKLFYAVMTDENEETYGAVKRLEGAVELTVEATENLSSLAADNNNAYVTEEALGEITVSATIAAISTEDYCAIFGKKLAKTGGIIESANDVKP